MSAGPYANLFPVRYFHSLPKEVRDGCARIESRTEATAYLDVYRNALCFGYVKRGSPVLLDILVPAGTKFDPALDRLRVNGVVLPCGVDDVVRLINMAKIDPRTKDTWAQWHENSRRSDAERDRDQMIADGRGEVAKLVASKRRRQQMGRHFKGRAVVNGLKS